MKNFSDSEPEIMHQFTKQVYARFYKTRFGIKGCADDKCFDLGVIRYELLKHQQNADPFNALTSLTAGIDQRIQLPTTTTTLTAVFTGTDLAEVITWTQIAGDPVTIVSPDQLITEITGLSSTGNYEFEVSVITENGIVLKDSVEVLIIAAAPATEVIQWGYSTTNPYASIYDGNDFSFQFEMDYYPGTNVFTNLDFTDQANEKYLVLKEPVISNTKTTWFNTAFNFGSIPDQVFRSPITVSGYRYYVSRIPVFFAVGTAAITFE